MFKMHTFSPDNIKLIVNIILLKKIFPYQDQVIYNLVHISKWGAIIFSFQCVFPSKFYFFHDHLNFIWCLLWSLLLPTNLEKNGFHLQCHVTLPQPLNNNCHWWILPHKYPNIYSEKRHNCKAFCHNIIKTFKQ
jgi:hypothetical protein